MNPAATLSCRPIFGFESSLAILPPSTGAREMIFAIEVDAVECHLQRVLVQCELKTIRYFLKKLLGVCSVTRISEHNPAQPASFRYASPFRDLIYRAGWVVSCWMLVPSTPRSALRSPVRLRG